MPIKYILQMLQAIPGMLVSFFFVSIPVVLMKAHRLPTGPYGRGVKRRLPGPESQLCPSDLCDLMWSLVPQFLHLRNGVKWVNTVQVLRQVHEMCTGTDSAQRCHHRDLPINLGKLTLLFLVTSLLSCQFFTNWLFFCPKDLKAPCSGHLVSSFSCEGSHTHVKI